MLAFIHFITPPLLMKLFDRAKKISPKLLFFAAIGGIFPDMDYFYIWLLNIIRGEPLSFAHRSLFHNIFFILLLASLVLVLYSQNNRYTKYTAAFAFGVAIHLILDFIDVSLPLFYPFSTQHYGFFLFKGPQRAERLIMLEAVAFYIWAVYVSITNRLTRIL